MRKLIAIGAGALAAATMTGLLGHGIAAALPDVSGQPYGKVKQLLSQAGLKSVVATRVGDRVDENNCIVDRAQPATVARGGMGAQASGTVYVYLNCYGSGATPNSPGYSQQDPMGKKAQANASQ